VIRRKIGSYKNFGVSPTNDMGGKYRGRNSNKLFNSNDSILSNLAFKSRPGALPGKPIKTNQDSYIVASRMLNLQNCGLYAVADGHGLYGHFVSRFIKKVLPSKISFP